MSETKYPNGYGEMNDFPTGPRIALLGDSVMAGLGVRGRSYGVVFAESMGASKVLNLSRSTYTVSDCVNCLDKVRAFQPDLIVVGMGSADSAVHVSERFQRLLIKFAPKTWHGIEGLSPRVYYRGSKQDQRKQRISTLKKVLTAHVAIRLTGRFHRTPIVEFDAAVAAFFGELAAMECPVIVCGLADSDWRLFPCTPKAQTGYRQALKQHAESLDNFFYIDFRPALDRWDDYLADHGHPTLRGHEKAAAYLSELWAQAPVVQGVITASQAGEPESALASEVAS